MEVKNRNFNFATTSSELKNSAIKAGLYIVATDIGNIYDITFRAVGILASVDKILAEDSRKAGILCQQWQINTPLESWHEHNEQQKITSILQELQNGAKIALISDAGTPLVCDPGFILVRACKQKNIPVIPIPGACAAISALSATGLSTDRFEFMGFVPRKTEQKTTLFKIPCGHTQIFYETTRRIEDTLNCLASVKGHDFIIAIAREISKPYEQIITDSVANIQKAIKNDTIILKGEMVLLLDNKSSNKNHSKDEFLTNDYKWQQLLGDLTTHLAPKLACKIVAGHYGLSSKQIYNYYLATNSNSKNK